jgi:hypothetical protein
MKRCGERPSGDFSVLQSGLASSHSSAAVVVATAPGLPLYRAIFIEDGQRWFGALDVGDQRGGAGRDRRRPSRLKIGALKL